jgi:hypothetical protein
VVRRICFIVIPCRIVPMKCLATEAAEAFSCVRSE